jgi:hypothetical protein
MATSPGAPNLSLYQSSLGEPKQCLFLTHRNRRQPQPIRGAIVMPQITA